MRKSLRGGEITLIVRLIWQKELLRFVHRLLGMLWSLVHEMGMKCFEYFFVHFVI